MMNKIGKMRALITISHQYRFELLFLSLMMLLFGEAFFTVDLYENIVHPIFLSLSILSGWNLLKGQRFKRRFVVSFFWLIILVEILKHQTELPYLRIVGTLLYIVCFLIFSHELFSQILNSKKVDRGILLAALSGYIVLGLIGGFLFVVMFSFDPSSFSIEHASFQDMVYFSFITILSIGYGDVVPLTLVAKKLTIFVGLIGHFYSVVIMGLIIGKYLNNNSETER